jgi:hypothetical protein
VIALTQIDAVPGVLGQRLIHGRKQLNNKLGKDLELMREANG